MVLTTIGVSALKIRIIIQINQTNATKKISPRLPFSSHKNSFDRKKSKLEKVSREEVGKLQKTTFEWTISCSNITSGTP